MISLTAVIRVRPGGVAAVEAALVECARTVARDEPGTLGFHVTRADSEPDVLLTYERFVDRAAMEAHNRGPASAAFFAAAGGHLDGPVSVFIGEEIAAA